MRRVRMSSAVDDVLDFGVDLFFALRARPVTKTYLNLRLIRALRAKAGVPERDVRGRITSHRAQATIASHLYNAKDP